MSSSVSLFGIKSSSRLHWRFTDIPRKFFSYELRTYFHISSNKIKQTSGILNNTFPNKKWLYTSWFHTSKSWKLFGFCFNFTFKEEWLWFLHIKSQNNTLASHTVYMEGNVKLCDNNNVPVILDLRICGSSGTISKLSNWLMLYLPYKVRKII